VADVHMKTNTLEELKMVYDSFDESILISEDANYLKHLINQKDQVSIGKPAVHFRMNDPYVNLIAKSD
jgi:hypothetical protein